MIRFPELTPEQLATPALHTATPGNVAAASEAEAEAEAVILPDTGAPEHLGSWTLLGGLMLALGSALPSPLS